MTITREQIARLRGIGCAYVINEQVEALLDAAEAHLSEQSRIDAAVAKERERCAALEEGLRDAAAYLAVFVSIYEKTPSFRLDALHKTKRADYRAALKRVQALVSPTPATEEGA